MWTKKARNMSYTRFQNTLSDLQDCYEHLHDKLSEDEDRARDRMITLCGEIASEGEDLEINEEESGEKE
jgi:hypothetical protein